jgi:hypothetical protein
MPDFGHSGAMGKHAVGCARSRYNQLRQSSGDTLMSYFAANTFIAAAPRRGHHAALDVLTQHPHSSAGQRPCVCREQRKEGETSGGEGQPHCYVTT